MSEPTEDELRQMWKALEGVREMSFKAGYEAGVRSGIQDVEFALLEASLSDRDDPAKLQENHEKFSPALDLVRETYPDQVRKRKS